MRLPFHVLIPRGLVNAIKKTYRYEVSPLFFLAAGVTILAGIRLGTLPFMNDVKETRPERTESHFLNALRKQEQACQSTEGTEHS